MTILIGVLLYLYFGAQFCLWVYFGTKDENEYIFMEHSKQVAFIMVTGLFWPLAMTIVSLGMLTELSAKAALRKLKGP
jgi:hypothetical protein